MQTVSQQAIHLQGRSGNRNPCRSAFSASPCPCQPVIGLTKRNALTSDTRAATRAASSEQFASAARAATAPRAAAACCCRDARCSSALRAAGQAG
jgi:hypothetical protein